MTVRDYLYRDRRAVTALLQIVPQLYPGGLDWLEKRLDEVESGRASCTLAFQNNVLGGALIDVSKGARITKISTLFVSDRFSNNGLGGKLFSRCHLRWLRSGIEKLYVTVAAERRAKIEPFLFARDFKLTAIEQNRYGPTRDELVFSAALG